MQNYKYAFYSVSLNLKLLNTIKHKTEINRPFKKISPKDFRLKTILTVFGLLSILFISGCNDVELKSQYLSAGSSPITVDGNLSDWKTDSFLTFEDNGIKIAAANDNNYYYIGGEITDRNIGRVFALNGMALLISPDGNKDNCLYMTFTYPDKRHMDYNKGGFFQTLNENQKTKALKKINKLKNAVFVIDTSNLVSQAFFDSTGNSDSKELPDFQGRMNISNNVLYFEIKFPIQINKYFKMYNSLNEKSIFCLTPFSSTNNTQMHRFPSEGSYMRDNRILQRDMDNKSFNRAPQNESELWFSIKTINYE